MTEQPSRVLALLTVLRAADTYAGRCAGLHPHDWTHPDRVSSTARAEQIADEFTALLVAMERALERDVGLPGGARAGDSSKVRIVEDNTPDSHSSLCKNCTTWEGSHG